MKYKYKNSYIVIQKVREKGQEFYRGYYDSHKFLRLEGDNQTKLSIELQKMIDDFLRK